jgi:diguanylate cyclase (GGDEF)-like protein
VSIGAARGANQTVALRSGDHRVTARGLRRIDPGLERQFQATFDRDGLGLRSELWLGIVLFVGVILIFHRYLLNAPPQLLSLAPLLLVGVGIPAVLRWLSGTHSPWNRWSQAMFVVATYLDITCMMTARIVSLQHGVDVLPVVVPISILMSLVVAQLRFALLVPTILLGLVGIAVAELTLTAVTSNSLFQLTASAAIVCVSLTSAYELQNSSRAAWLRQRELIELTRIDSLTGLPNRRYFAETLRGILGSATRNEPIVLAIFDLDAFKALNDRFGHPAGDECLRAIGAHLRDQIHPEHEFAARHGGEEFVVVWQGTDPDHARARIEQLRRSIGELSIAALGPAVVTASAGSAELCVAAGDSTELTADQQAGLTHALMKRADRAVYRAKESGRDRTEHDLSPVRTADPVTADTQPAAYDDTGPQLHATLTTLRFERPEDESAFLSLFEVQGRRARRFIMIGLLIVCAAIFTSQEVLLKMPPAASTFGRLTLAVGIAPAAVVALIGASWSRLQRWSAPIYIAAVAVVLTAQMFERAIQTPRGFDVVPFLMPVSVLLSLGVVRIVYRLLMPSMVALLAGLIVCELSTIAVTGNEVLTINTTVVMVYATVRFAYVLERTRRLDWSRSQILEILSHTDPLTRLPNRRSFTAALRDEVAAGRTPELLLIDVDHFKEYNDRFGHIAGDECLSAVGAQLQRAAHAHGGIAARLGGEEFAVILPDGHDSRDRAEALRTAVTGPPPEDAAGLSITVSAGLAAWPVDAPVDDPDTAAARLIERADAALYEAKRNGRNRLAVDVDHNGAAGLSG